MSTIVDRPLTPLERAIAWGHAHNVAPNDWQHLAGGAVLAHTDRPWVPVAKVARPVAMASS